MNRKTDEQISVAATRAIEIGCPLTIILLRVGTAAELEPEQHEKIVFKPKEIKVSETGNSIVGHRLTSSGISNQEEEINFGQVIDIVNAPEE